MPFGTPYVPLNYNEIVKKQSESTNSLFSLSDHPELNEIEIDGAIYKYYRIKIILNEFNPSIDGYIHPLINVYLINFDPAIIINKIDQDIIVVNINNYKGYRRIVRWDFYNAFYNATIVTSGGNISRTFREFICSNQEICDCAGKLVSYIDYYPNRDSDEKSNKDPIIINQNIRTNKLTYKQIIIKPPKTTIIWSDGTKTIMRFRSNGSTKYDPIDGVKLAACKKLYGDKFTELFNEINKRVENQ